MPRKREAKKPDSCRQKTGCGIRKDSHTETEADKGYFTGQDKTGKTFCHVRASEREQVSSVGIGKSHTPIMENTSSAYTVSDILFLVKVGNEDFTPARRRTSIRAERRT